MEEKNRVEVYLHTDKGLFINTTFYPKQIINHPNFKEIADEDARWGYEMHMKHYFND